MSATINTNPVKQIAALASVSLIVAVVLFFLDIQFFPTRPYMKPADGAFIESILLILSGLLVFIGSGGISESSRKAAVLASAAKAIFDRDIIGPSEIYRRDAWKLKGYKRLGLVLILTGLFLLIIYLAFA